MKIHITEGAPRTFIPYQIVIQIENEFDHQSLQDSAKKLRDKDSYFFGKTGSLGNLAEKILYHVPK